VVRNTNRGCAPARASVRSSHQVEIPDPRILRFHVGLPDVAAGMLVQPPAYDDRQDQVGHALERAGVDPAVAGPEPVDGVGQRLRLRRCGGRCVPNDGTAPNCPGRLTELERSGVRTVWLTSGRAADRWLAEQAAVDSR
jgi:hypothetical protein